MLKFFSLFFLILTLVINTGVWCVGNIGHEEGSLLWPLLAAYATYPLYKNYPGEMTFTAMILAASYAFDWFSKKWRRQQNPKKPVYK